MGLPVLGYIPGTTTVYLNFHRGPVDFQCTYKGRLNDNVSTSGLRERVVEHLDILITFKMPAIRVSDDLMEWQKFQQFALGGGQFAFVPNSALPTVWYNCVSDDDAFELTRVGPGTYSAQFRWRIVPDDKAPADGPGEVMRRFYGIAG